MTQPNPKNLVWHYTTLETLEKILSTQTLLATEANFQNDPNEVSYAQSMITAALERARGRHKGAGNFLVDLAKHLNDPPYSSVNLDRLLDGSRFLLCGSADGDSMYCWRTYGAIGDVSCAVGLDPAVPLGIKESTSRQKTSWQSVSYSTKELQNQVDSLIDQIIEEYQESGVGDEAPNHGVLITGYSSIQTLILSAAKSPSYADEREFRITVTDPPRTAIRFGAGKAGPRPRVGLTTLAPSPGGPTEDENALPIREIRLGPTAPLGAEQSLRWILAAYGYSLDGVQEFEMYEDERGNTVRNARLNQSRRVRVSLSEHAFRDV
ncbi:hypothetical protein L1277_002716 [Okibacterium sp. HSC-33S16]|uniref:DUF2971 domain-containing protein n=1 Tax=Okibacterium sp. HSC-33S16 TaxID=2910965 RepID=UPI00209FF245|nr:DUF2971 domain-containing protein [Okibacterium sp. HSC-33S16]MCP2032606.1 hypothetical protein [Okibacterium sp. HSC-33S16]